MQATKLPVRVLVSVKRVHVQMWLYAVRENGEKECELLLYEVKPEGMGAQIEHVSSFLRQRTGVNNRMARWMQQMKVVTGPQTGYSVAELLQRNGGPGFVMSNENVLSCNIHSVCGHNLYLCTFTDGQSSLIAKDVWMRMCDAMAVLVHTNEEPISFLNAAMMVRRIARHE